MDLINVGDRVRILFNNGVREDVTVLHTPADVGDMWYFETEDGDIVAQNPVSTNLDCLILLPAKRLSDE